MEKKSSILNRGGVQISKIYKGSTLLWENWKHIVQDLAYKSASGTISWASDKQKAWASATVNFGFTARIKKVKLYSKCIRVDISGRVSGTLTVYGVTANGTKIKIAEATNQWDTTDVVSSDQTTEFVGVYYEAYGHDRDVNRDDTYVFQWRITEYDRKG